MPRVLPPLVALLAFGASAGAALPKLDGWFPCADSTFAEEEATPAAASTSSSGSGSATTATALRAECATFQAPLCYEGICDEAGDTLIDIFVKRIVATAEDKPHVFFLQGGPGAASPAMESAMTGLYAELSGNVNVYTMDHRGTGRSTKLDCVAAQAQTSGSPGGTTIVASEVASCAADLEAKFGRDMAAFSVTSAASDLHLFISSFLNDSQTFVYGVSYGSSLVERLIHLNTTSVAGYILDGISTTSGAAATAFEYYSKWDVDYDQVGAHFLSFCAQSTTDCGQYFPDTTVSDALRTLTTNLDSPSYQCTTAAREMLATVYGDAPPAESLRSFMGTLLADAALRPLIPVVTYRLTRCSDDDVAVLRHFFAQYASSSSAAPSEDDQYGSDLVYKLIVYSEFWETPTPSADAMFARFTNTTISSGLYGQVETYCLFTKETSAGCKPFASESQYDASPLVYKKDQFWNVAAAPPHDVSVLLLSSKMDPQTPHKYAETLLDVLATENKALITFEHATHATLWSTPTTAADTDPSAPTCGLRLVASYVAVGGDLAKMDRSCLAEMPPVSFAVGDGIVRDWLNTTAAVDGPFVGSSTASGGDNDRSDHRASYRTVFIVVLALFVVTLLAAGAFLLKWRKAKKASEAHDKAVAYDEATHA